MTQEQWILMEVYAVEENIIGTYDSREQGIKALSEVVQKYQDDWGDTPLVIPSKARILVKASDIEWILVRRNSNIVNLARV